MNNNLQKSESRLYYSVQEFLTTFGQDKGKTEPFTHEEKFEGSDLLKCKIEAEKYYWKRLNELEGGSYILPFASPEDFVEGKHVAFSLVFSLVDHYAEDCIVEHPLIGESEEEMSESREVEAQILKEKGYMNKIPHLGGTVSCTQ